MGIELIGPAGSNGLDGLSGQDGRTIFNGDDDPLSTEGQDGDFYINTSSSNLFGPKKDGVWPIGVSLFGTQGPQCPQGAQGPQGPQGPQGSEGPQGPEGSYTEGEGVSLLNGEISIGQSVSEVDDVTFNKLNISSINLMGTDIDANPNEINILSGATSASTITLTNTDRLIINDDGNMIQVDIESLKNYTNSNFSLNDLTDGKANDTDFENSLLIGDLGPGTLDNAEFNVGVGYGVFSRCLGGDRTMGLGYNSLNKV